MRLKIRRALEPPHNLFSQYQKSMSMPVGSTLLAAVLFLVLLVEPHENVSADDKIGNQLAALLCDRPEMRFIVGKQSKLFEYLQRQFGEVNASWDCSEPESTQPSEFAILDDKDSVCIRISGDSSVSARDKWFLLAFELENSKNAQRFSSLIEMASNSKVSKGQFIRRAIHLEIQSLNATRTLLSKLPIPGCTADNAPIYFSLGAVNLDPDLFLAQLGRSESSSYDPRKHFGDMYDGVVWRRSLLQSHTWRALTDLRRQLESR